MRLPLRLARQVVPQQQEENDLRCHGQQDPGCDVAGKAQHAAPARDGLQAMGMAGDRDMLGVVEIRFHRRGAGVALVGISAQRLEHDLFRLG